jgi:outer membrane lipoprotein carrier protein
MNKLLITLLLLCGLGLSFAQTGVKEEVDPKAKAILDELSSKTKACNSIKSDFTIENLGSDKKVKDSNAGSITLKGLKYVLNVKGQKIICDGKSQWTVISESKEVQVNNAPDPKSTDQVNPTNIFTLYEKGYKYKFEKEEVIAGTLNQVINLYPKNPITP